MTREGAVRQSSQYVSSMAGEAGGPDLGPATGPDLGPWPPAEFDTRLMDTPGYVRDRQGRPLLLADLIKIAKMPPQEGWEKEGREAGVVDDGDGEDDGWTRAGTR